MLQHELTNGETLYRKMILLSDQLAQEIEIVQKQIATYPAGELHCRRNGTYTKWYLHINGKFLYIPKTQQKFAQRMANKKYLTELLKDLQYEYQEVTNYLHTHKENPQHARKLLAENTAYTNLLIPSAPSKNLVQWAQVPFETNPFHPERKIHIAPGNIRVRSKSEVLIATLLYTNHIPFRYECALQIGGRTIYPDFTIRHPETGEIYYWEHFGKMDDPEYQKNAFDKIQLYTKNGIQPHIRLIITTETATNPLSVHTIECRIQEFFPLEHANPA